MPWRTGFRRPPRSGTTTAAGAVGEQGPGAALAAGPVASGGGATRAAQLVWTQRIDLRPPAGVVVEVEVVVGGIGKVVALRIRHAAETPSDGRDAVTTLLDQLETSPVG